MQNPFANVDDPPDPNEVLPASPIGDMPDPPEPDGPRATATTRVNFPVVLTDTDGQLVPVLVEDLALPAQRIAELVEALQEALVTPPVIAQLEQLVAKANCIEVTDAESYRLASETYELLAANEKGIESTIGPVVGFFHRPWHAMTKYRARFAKPVEAAKKQLSDRAGAWDVAEKRKAEEQRRADEQAQARDEKARLQKLADAAKQAGDTRTAAVVEQMKEEVTAPALPLPSYKPAVESKSRKSYVAVIVDAEAFYAAIGAGTIEHRAAPIDLAYLNRQAKDLGEELGKRYPGVEAREKGGLTASGK